MGRLRGCLWLTAGLVVAVLAGAVAYLALDQAIIGSGDVGGESGPTVEVVVAATNVDVRSLLTADDLELRTLPVQAAPEGAVRELDGAIGKVTLVDLYPDEVVLAQQLADPNIVTGDGRLALVVAEDEVLMAFPARDLMSRVGVLKPGDHIDILFSLDFPTNRSVQPLLGEGEVVTGGASAAVREEQSTFNLLQNATIAAIVGGGATEGEGGAPDAILLTVSPQDALLLKYAVDAGGVVDIVLRAPGVEGPFDVEPVDVDYMINRYGIPNEVGR